MSVRFAMKQQTEVDKKLSKKLEKNELNRHFGANGNRRILKEWCLEKEKNNVKAPVIMSFLG